MAHKIINVAPKVTRERERDFIFVDDVLRAFIKMLDWRECVCREERYGVPLGSKVYYQCYTLNNLRATLNNFTCHVNYFTCHVNYLTCHVNYLKCHVNNLRATLIILRATLNDLRGT